MSLSTRATAALLAIAALGAGGHAPAGSEADTRAELAKVQARIRAVTEAVQAEAATRNDAAAALKAADQALREARERLDAARDERTAAQARQGELKARRDAARAALDVQRSALAADLRVAYRGGRDEPLKLWLNVASPEELGRVLVYAGYVTRARTERIRLVEADLARLAQLEADLARQADELAGLARAQEQQVRALNGAKAARERALAVVDADLDSRSSELARLRANAGSLETLLARLRDAIRDIPADDYAQAGRHRQPFAQLRGRLPWPAAGTVAATFGAARPGGLVWQGLLLDTPPGTSVRAPYYGRVVYADWLPGLGLLLILDHGEGYLTLYGNNEKLYRKVGDLVGPGEVLAASAAGEGSMASQMYFEVRHGKDPQDPRVWLRPAGARR